MTEGKIYKAYDILFIIKPHLADEQYQKICDTFSGWVTTNNGEVTVLTKTGIRDLATPIGKFTHGYFVNIQFKANNEILDEIKKRFAIDENILRHMLVTMDSIKAKPKALKEVKE